jgi:hypothetical protein
MPAPWAHNDLDSPLVRPRLASVLASLRSAYAFLQWIMLELKRERDSNPILAHDGTTVLLQFWCILQKPLWQ